MSIELEHLAARVAAGGLDRRAFLGRAAALGVAAPFANAMLAGAAHAQEPRSGGTLKAGMQGGESTDSLDPATFESSVPQVFGRCWGETLLEVAADGTLLNRLAEEVEASEDAKTWRFKMRKDVEFHNGKTLTAEDAMATIERHAGEESKSGALGLLRGIGKMRVENDTFIVELDGPNADLPYYMTDYHLAIQPNGGKDDPSAGIGTGPYTVEVNNPGVRHAGAKFENYWDPGRGHAADVEVIVINDPTARTSALQGGQVQMINRVEPKIVDLVKRVPGVEIQNAPGRGHYVFICHVNTPPFDDNDVRLALKYALDREEMVNKILRGYGSMGNDTPINQAYPLFTELEQRSYDPDRAKHHIKKSGQDGPILLRTSEVAFPGAVDATQLYQQSCQAAGIDLQIERVPGDGYWSEVWNQKPFCASYWGGRPTQDQMFTVAYLSTADWNDTRWKRESFDNMLYKARATLDRDKRQAIYADMNMMLHEEGGVMTPMFNDFIDATGKGVAGYRPDPNYELMNFKALIECWVPA